MYVMYVCISLSLYIYIYTHSINNIVAVDVLGHLPWDVAGVARDPGDGQPPGLRPGILHSDLHT